MSEYGTSWKKVSIVTGAILGVLLFLIVMAMWLIPVYNRYQARAARSTSCCRPDANSTPISRNARSRVRRNASRLSCFRACAVVTNPPGTAARAPHAARQRSR